MTDFLTSPSTHAYIPPPPLADHVALLWRQSNHLPAHPKERCLPDGSVEWILNLGEDDLPIYPNAHASHLEWARDGVVMGAHSRYFVIDTAHPVTILGVHFKPGGAFFACPADELHDQGIALDCLLGRRIGELREQLMAAATPQAQFGLLECFLLAEWYRYQKGRPQHPAVRFAIDEFAARGRSVAAVTEQLSLSSTRFTQLFRAQVGLTPKVFSRVQRFQRVIRRLENQQAVDWVALALDCGYYDQAHFIHDFQAFSGLNPTTYAAQPGKRLNHVPLLV